MPTAELNKAHASILHLEQSRILCCRHYHCVLLALVLLPFYLQAVPSQANARKQTQVKNRFSSSVSCCPQTVGQPEEITSTVFPSKARGTTIFSQLSAPSNPRGEKHENARVATHALLQELQVLQRHLSPSFGPKGLMVLQMLKEQAMPVIAYTCNAFLCGNARTWSRLISRRSRSLSRFSFWTALSLVSTTPWSDAISFSTASIPSNSP